MGTAHGRGGAHRELSATFWAAYYARKMGLPIRKLVCASNANKVLTDFIRTGTYDRRREFHATASPSMDILISSNLERLLYDLCGEDSATAVPAGCKHLAETGVYSVGDAVREKDAAAVLRRLLRGRPHLPDHPGAVGSRSATSATPTPPWRWTCTASTGSAVPRAACPHGHCLHGQPLQVLRQRAGSALQAGLHHRG